MKMRCITMVVIFVLLKQLVIAQYGKVVYSSENLATNALGIKLNFLVYYDSLWIVRTTLPDSASLPKNWFFKEDHYTRSLTDLEGKLEFNNIYENGKWEIVARDLKPLKCVLKDENYSSIKIAKDVYLPISQYVIEDLKARKQGEYFLTFKSLPAYVSPMVNLEGLSSGIYKMVLQSGAILSFRQLDYYADGNIPSSLFNLDGAKIKDSTTTQSSYEQEINIVKDSIISLQLTDCNGKRHTSIGNNLLLLQFADGTDLNTQKEYLKILDNIYRNKKDIQILVTLPEPYAHARFLKCLSHSIPPLIPCVPNNNKATCLKTFSKGKMTKKVVLSQDDDLVKLLEQLGLN